MSSNRFLARSAVVTGTLGLITLAGAGTALAHVTAQPEQATKGDHSKVTFRVPNERLTAGTVKLHVSLPLDHPVSEVQTKPMPGWTAQVEKVKLPRPIQEAGAQVTDAVSGITWTADPGTRIAPDQFQEFDANIGTLPTDTTELVMPAEQTYDNGEVVKWDEPPAAPGAPEPEHPAPTVKLVDDKGQSTGMVSPRGDAPTASPTGDATARWLGGAGLLVGALGLGVGAGALLRGRRTAPNTGKET
jgi:uncharacterized protein YcnI